MAIKKQIIKPVAAAVGVAFVSSLAISATAHADENPFAMSDLDTGYMLAAHHGKGEEGKCGEGKCGEGHGDDDKGEEGKCGEGKCGEGHGDDDKGEEGKCGEGKCGEGKCGGA
jgi:uncharacterized low-complexity protein